MKETPNQLKKNEKDLLKQDAFLLYYHQKKEMKVIAALFKRSPRTIYRWIKERKTAQANGPVPPKVRRKRPRKYPPAVFERIITLKKELPRRTGSGIHRLMHQESPTSCPSVHLIRKFLAQQGLSQKDPNAKKGYVKFARDRPNDLWQIDIAGVQTIGPLGKVYLHAILDDCSRFIVAARYFKTQQGINILWILRAAFEEYGRPNQILADNGTQFRNTIGELGTKYSRLLQLLDIQPIFASPHHPQTKGKLERWFGTVKTNFLTEKRYYLELHPQTTLDQFNQLFQEWLYWYNFEKPHRSLPNFSTPAPVYLKHPNRITRPLNILVDWNRWILSKGTRKVSKYNTISYKTKTISLPPGYMGCKVEILEADDQLEIYFRDTCLKSCAQPQKVAPQPNKTVLRKVTRNGTFSYNRRYYLLGPEHDGKVVEIKEYNDGKRIAVYKDGVLLVDLDKSEGKPKQKTKKKR